jgi:hypothetical protein
MLAWFPFAKRTEILTALSDIGREDLGAIHQGLTLESVPQYGIQNDSIATGVSSPDKTCSDS